MSMRYIGRSVFLLTLISGEKMENKDIEYFDNLWQKSKPKDGMKHTKGNVGQDSTELGSRQPKGKA